jgi:hypothetical protein
MAEQARGAGQAAAGPVSADDLAVTLAVREDLGPEHEPAVVAEFLDRVGAAIDQRVDERVAAAAQPPREERSGPSLAFFSLIFGIPITAIAGSQGLPSLLVAWAGIAAVNLADGLRR